MGSRRTRDERAGKSLHTVERNGRQMRVPDVTTTVNPRPYLERIHCSSGVNLDTLEPSLPLLRTLHEAHMLAVPFENLSIHYGQPITLGDEALYDKIVRRRRAGFCYELNGLFAWLLRQLESTVTLPSAPPARAAGGFSPAVAPVVLHVHPAHDSA